MQYNCVIDGISDFVKVQALTDPLGSPAPFEPGHHVALYGSEGS